MIGYSYQMFPSRVSFQETQTRFDLHMSANSILETIIRNMSSGNES